MIQNSKVIFVGEEPSKTALRMGVTWKDGRLAGKQLFDAFEANGFDPGKAFFINLFKDGTVDPGVLCLLIMNAGEGIPIVAMGKKVQKELDGLNCIPMVHPAARGTIRKKENYINHVKTILEQIK